MRIEKEKYMAEALALARECADLLSDFSKPCDRAVLSSIARLYA